jgi:Histidine kinase
MGALALDASRPLSQKCSMDDATRRLLAATYEERHRIERALHEGVQQDLIALSVRLQLLERSVRADPDAVPALLAELRADVRTALERVRELAASVYPPLLADRGLAEALRALGSRVDAEGAAHAPEAVEAAAYFCCRDLRPRRVRLWSDETLLRLELEGVRGDVVAARERAESLGGSLSGDGGSLELTLPRGKDGG